MSKKPKCFTIKSGKVVCNKSSGAKKNYNDKKVKCSNRKNTWRYTPCKGGMATPIGKKKVVKGGGKKVVKKKVGARDSRKKDRIEKYKKIVAMLRDALVNPQKKYYGKYLTFVVDMDKPQKEIDVIHKKRYVENVRSQLRKVLDWGKVKSHFTRSAYDVPSVSYLNYSKDRILSV